MSNEIILFAKLWKFGDKMVIGIKAEDQHKVEHLVGKLLYVEIQPAENAVKGDRPSGTGQL